MHLKTLCSNLVLVNYAFFSSGCGCTWASICWSKDVFVVLCNWCQRSAVSWHPEAEQWVLLALMDTGNKRSHLTAAFSLAQQPCSLVLRGIIAAHSDDLWPHLQPASELCMRVCVCTVKKNREKMTVCVYERQKTKGMCRFKETKDWNCMGDFVESSRMLKFEALCFWITASYARAVVENRLQCAANRSLCAVRVQEYHYLSPSLFDLAFLSILSLLHEPSLWLYSEMQFLIKSIK